MTHLRAGRPNARVAAQALTRSAHPQLPATRLLQKSAATCGSLPRFTRPPSRGPRPPHSWQTPESLLAARFRRLRGDALSGRFRRFLAESAIAHRLLMAEHQVGSTSIGAVARKGSVR
jgi:hypothetical protein